MKRFLAVALAWSLLAASVLVGAPSEARAQARPQKANGDGAGAQGSQLTALALYEEASRYARGKFEELTRNRVPYDPQLANRILQEQRELAVRHAATLAARGPLSGTDLFYLGMLYSVGDNHDGAYTALRRFLSESNDAKAEMRQDARRTLIQETIKLGLLDEAEKSLADYLRDAPQKPEDRYLLENKLAAAFYARKQFDRAEPHALESFRAAKPVLANSADQRKRDDTLLNLGYLLADIYTKQKKRPEAVATMHEVRQLGLSLPSAQVYSKASDVLARYGETFNPIKTDARASAQIAAAPALVVSDWIDHAPTKLSELRGHVVLLDFWATWCSPCLAAIPKLNALLRKYKEQGLVIVGVTEFQGAGDGRPMTPAEELAFLRQFKSRYKVAYPYAVSDKEDNGRNFGVSSLPTAVLIDRQGRVRHFIVGIYEGSDEELAAAIKDLLEEPAGK